MDLDLDPDSFATVRLADRLLDRTDLGNLPAPEPLIENTVDLDTVHVVYGAYGTLKTFLALDWTASAVTGRAWQGRATRKIDRALYVAAEGAHGLNDRITAWEAGWGHTIPPGAFTVLPEPLNLGSGLAVAELVDTVQEGGYQLVVFDTLARCMVGLEENSARDIGLAVDALYRVKTATAGGTVLALHHPGKDKETMRGSSALEDGIDVRHLIRGDSSGIVVTRTKRKEGPTDDAVSLKLDLIPGTESGVLSQTAVRSTDATEKVFSQFVSHFSETGATRSQLCEVCDVSTASVYRAVNVLVTDGRLRNVGTEQRAFYQLPT